MKNQQEQGRNTHLIINVETSLSVKQSLEDRMLHTMVVGESNKRILLSEIKQDILNTEAGISVFDPHGDFAEEVQVLCGRYGREVKVVNATSRLAIDDYDIALRDGKVIVVTAGKKKFGDLGKSFVYAELERFISSVFRRQPKTRIPNFLYVPDFSDIVRPELVTLLTLGRSYRVAVQLGCNEVFGETYNNTHLAELIEKISNNCRSIIVDSSIKVENVAPSFHSVSKLLRESNFQRSEDHTDRVTYCIIQDLELKYGIGILDSNL